MKILLVGTGGVGEAIAVVAKDRPWLERVVLADLSLERALEVAQKVGGGTRFPVERLDASSKGQVLALAQKHEVDLILNAVEPRFNMPLFDAAFEAGVHYLDMAMSLSQRHPTDPYHEPGLKLGDEQVRQSRGLGGEGAARAGRHGGGARAGRRPDRLRRQASVRRDRRGRGARRREPGGRGVASRRTSRSGPRSRSV